MIFSVKEIAEFFEVSERRIQQWVTDTDYLMPRESNGEYDFIKCVKWRIKFLETEIESLGKEGDKKLNELKREGESLKNIERLVKIEMIAKNLLDRGMVQRVWITELAILKQNLIGAIYKINELVKGVENDDARLALIKNEIDFTLQSISELPLDETEEDEEIFEDEILKEFEEE